MSSLDRLEGYLREHHASFQMQRHHRTVTAGETAASEHIPPQMLTKVVMIVADEQLVMLAVPASARVDLTRVAAALDAGNVRLAAEYEFAHIFSDCEVGAMPPFGNLYHLPVCVDRQLAQDDVIVVPAGTHTETISIEYQDFARLVRPVVADLTYGHALALIPAG
jgi:Ala-tRNA(Pro) deacylase